MGAICSGDLSFRPAFPDEESRAKYVESYHRPTSAGSWFLAVTDGPPERIVGTIRHGRNPEAREAVDGIDFRLSAGPGRELEGREEEFLASFIGHLGRDFRGRLRHMRLIPADHPWDAVFAAAGFTPGYREFHLLAPLEALAKRVKRNYDFVRRHPSPLERGRMITVRDCDPEQAIGLIAGAHLMEESEIRAVWKTEDRTLLDRDASACFFLDDRLIGVILGRDGGDTLVIPAIVVREDVPRAKGWLVARLLQHLFDTTASRAYTHVGFRANGDTAPTSINFARRAEGSTISEFRRWVKQIG